MISQRADAKMHYVFIRELLIEVHVALVANKEVRF